MDRDLRIRMLFEAMDRVTRPLRDITDGSTAAGRAIKATRDRLKEIERAQADLAGFRDLKIGLRDTDGRLQEAQTRVAQLAREMAQAGNPTKRLTNDFARAKREAAALKTEHSEQSTRLQQLRDRLSAAGVSTADLARHERALRTDAARTNAELREQQRRLVEVTDRSQRFAAARERFGRVQGMAGSMVAGGAAGIGTGVAIGAPIAGSVRAAMEYESVMTDIAQKASLSREEARQMGLGLMEAAKRANQLPESLQQGIDTLSGFGLDPRTAVRMVTPIGRAATAYKAEITDLSSAAFAANDNLKVPIEQTARAIDVMAAAGKSGAFEIKDMAQYFPMLTAASQALGQKGVPAVADLSAALQIARKGTGDSASAATNLANLLQKMVSPDTIKNFEKFGVDLPKALKKAYREGKTPIEAIAELTNRTLGGDLGRIGFLFGDAQVQQALRPLIQNIDQYKQIRADALNADGTVDADFAERMNDSAEKVKRLQIQGKSLSVVLGNQLKPAVNYLSDRFSAMSERIGAWAERNPGFVKGLAYVAAGLSALFLILGGGAIAIAGVLAPFAALAAVSTALGIGMLPVIGIAAAIVAGLALLAGAAYLIYRNWDGISAWFSGLWETIKASALSALGFFFGLPARFAQCGRDLILGLIGGITGMLGQLKSTIVNAASSAAEWFKKKLGIHSPSRVFMGLGGFMMRGLDAGIAGEAQRPIQRLDSLSKQLIGALAVGAAAPAVATPAISPVTPQSSSAGAAMSAAPSGPININIYQQPGQSAQDLARAVRAELDRIERERSARARSSYADSPDWS